MTHTIQRHTVLDSFTCLGAECEDTCCKTWSMQVDPETVARYRAEAHELLDAVEPAEETPFIMRKDTQTGYCIKLDGGLCGIHTKYGDRMLGDACHFYPRITRTLGSTTLMTATLSCPEVARIALFGPAPSYHTAKTDRLPQSLKHYLPEGMEEGHATAVHQAMLNAAMDESVDAEHAYLRIACASRQLQTMPAKNWALMISFYLSDADQRIAPPEYNPNDPFNLLHALCGLIVASRKSPHARLLQTITDMEAALSCTLDWQSVTIATNEQSIPSLIAVSTRWAKEGGMYAPVLRRWLAMQMSMHLHPFAGLGTSQEERSTLLGIRLGLVKLALQCAHMRHGALPQAEIVRITQSLSRFMDHLGDATFSLQIAAETGWTNEARMHGLLRL
jgi:lysine-N-methylase